MFFLNYMPVTCRNHQNHHVVRLQGAYKLTVTFNYWLQVDFNGRMKLLCCHFLSYRESKPSHVSQPSILFTALPGILTAHPSSNKFFLIRGFFPV